MVKLTLVKICNGYLHKQKKKKKISFIKSCQGPCVNLPLVVSKMGLILPVRDAFHYFMSLGPKLFLPNGCLCSGIDIIRSVRGIETMKSNC